ncbi:MAG: ABC transporter permease [Hyphomicrobiaceae bacterium]|nr:ABC transporter permease [Hyphomicrobiaceae bacterium]
MQQLLWFETLLKGSAGLVLLLLPLTAAHILGLPKPHSGLWPRLLGALLLGIAAAAYIEGAASSSRGLGLAGCAAINLIGAGTIISLLVLDAAAASIRGRAIMALLAGLLVLLSLFQIAHA